ncbi:uncharacterized protein BDW47DRAFT_83463 [Aspergillus candidus]|uniref:Secreted protein n=1 Tax=Aspergillus candidus TaxID=41067 RepID=A0A2I2FJU8_ASPCN|nr:hypothetical protein BDW47DRAFT_83463 [Aspergillus candidus]PLB40893.1 hypothetical protein BDW47DRAFT_83463 [Aspergillus candidus]
MNRNWLLQVLLLLINQPTPSYGRARARGESTRLSSRHSTGRCFFFHLDYLTNPVPSLTEPGIVIVANRKTRMGTFAILSCVLFFFPSPSFSPHLSFFSFSVSPLPQPASVWYHDGPGMSNVATVQGHPIKSLQSAENTKKQILQKQGER